MSLVIIDLQSQMGFIFYLNSPYCGGWERKVPKYTSMNWSMFE